MAERRPLDGWEEHRPSLQAVAYRMLGSRAEAEDAVQEAWIRVHRADTTAVENPGGWLKTVVARVCLDMLRARKARREDLRADDARESAPSREAREPRTAAGTTARDPATTTSDPEADMALADSVGLALLVLLDTLPPAERVAFVLHDLFDLSFDVIAPIVERSPDAARQLASRARRRVRGAPVAEDPDRVRQRRVVEAYLAAAREGDVAGLLAVLDPDIVLRSDAVGKNAAFELRGAEPIARRAVLGRARAARPILVDGRIGLLVAPAGRLLLVLKLTIEGDRVVAMDAVADPERLAALHLEALPG